MPNNEEAKKILKSYKQLIIRKQQMQKTINNLESAIQTAKGSNLDQNGFGGCNSSVAAKIARLVDLKMQFEKLEMQIYQQLFEIEKVLYLVASAGVIFANILYYKFIEFKTIEDIAELLGYCRSQTIRIYNKALVNFYIKYEEESHNATS